MDEGIYSRPEGRRAGTDLVMMLHGYGSNPERMTGWFGELPPHATGVALRGPMEVGGDRGWFLLDYFLANDFARVVSAAQLVFDWQDKYARGYRSISLLGHSQGMAMATTLHRLRPGGYATITGLSGFVLSNELLSLTDVAPEPGKAVPFFWGRDPYDLVINPDAVAYTGQWLGEYTALTSRTYPEMGHGFGAEERRDVRSFFGHYLAADRTV
ncbi:phospholipase [Paeniglutamicibacter sp. ABSL32-1]|uniref:alpha/beta hydrolase n=1 Tax=Paeniglutamicibacter quisquiliarum TaxID=2849498 RepID=UPI001C2D2DB7|nr:phospholipase [Paeniglutamicibacter quisquiliarum]MBV1779469.1 phospholipase [Paeniglutamicibacter quisquiliarum]